MVAPNLWSDYQHSRYTIEKLIGSGGMGNVFRVYDRLTGHIVALKRIGNLSTSVSASSEDLRITLAREFKTLATLRHPNIISVLDYGFDDAGYPFFIMEYIDQPQTIFEAGLALPLEVKVEMILQVMQALSYLHRRHILHHDLKPSNILVHEGRVKLLDFGLSIKQEQLTTEEKVSGTLAYVPPEALSGIYTVASDLYSLGMVMYELIHEAHPFRTDDFGTLLQQILKELPDITALNVSIELALVIQRLLQKSQEDRYGSVQEVIVDLCAAVGKPIPVETTEIRDSYLHAAEFVGRVREFNTLVQALDHAVAGVGGAWLIAGESGVGKSRLIEELRIHALVQGAQVVRGQAVSEGGMTYQIWRQILSRLAPLTPLDPSEIRVLRQLIPEITTLLGDVAPDDPEPEGVAMKDALSTVLLRILHKQRRPLVIILEDLHWVGEESLVVLDNLLASVRDLPVLILGSYRNDETPDLQRRLAGMQLLKLERLDKASIAELSASILGESGQRQEFVDFLANETEGNVFFIIEVVRELAERSGSLSDINRMRLPRHVSAGGIWRVVQNRLNHVPEAARYPLKVAAVIGRQVRLSLLTKIIPDLDLEWWLSTCANAAVLEVQDSRWQFAHDKLREGMLQALAPEERVELHRLVAMNIEAHYSDTSGRAVRLAYHWAMAGDAVKERHYAFIAGQQAYDVHSFREAIAFFTRVIETLPAELADPDQRHLWCSVKILIGSALIELGDVDQGREPLRQALSVGEANNDRLTVMQARLNLGMAAFRVGDYDEANAQLSQSLSLARLLDDADSTATSLYYIGAVAAHQQRFDEGRTKIQECLDLRRANNDRYGVARAYNGLGEVALLRGDIAEAQENYSQALPIFEEIDNQWWISGTYNNLGYSAMGLGDPVKALGYFQNALRGALELHAQPVMMEVLVGFGLLLWQYADEDLAWQIARVVQRSPSANTDARRKLQPAYEDLKQKHDRSLKTEILPMPLPELLDRLLAYHLNPPGSA